MKNKYVSSYSPKHVSNAPKHVSNAPKHVSNAPRARHTILPGTIVFDVFDEFTDLVTPEMKMLHEAIQETGVGLEFINSWGVRTTTLKRVENLAKQRGKHYDCWRHLWGTYLAKRLTR